MLTELSVKNFALIEELRMDFGPGFSVISGETGAGKSILVGALDLLTGGKASPVLVRTGEKEAVIEAVFEIAGHAELEGLLDDMGLRDDDRLLIRRHISSEGRSRIYVNGRSVTLAQLEDISSRLVDLSGQHAQQILLKEDNHLRFLDSSLLIRTAKKADPASAPFQKNLDAYAQVYSQYLTLKKEMEEAKRQVFDREKRVDFLRFQIREIEVGRLESETEEDDLTAERAKVKNADFLSELADFGRTAVSDSDSSALNLLNALILRLEKGAAMDESLNEAMQLIREAKPGLEELGRFFTRYADGISSQPGRLEEIEARLYQLYQLKRKYGATIREILDHFDAARKELDLLENYDENLARKEREVAEAAKRALELASQLSQARKAQACKLEKVIQGELVDLSMPNVTFRIQVEAPSGAIEALGPTGFDSVRFDMTANKGEKPKPLAQIASGGELSRVLLAIKKVLGARPHPVTYIFDEIDAGIGGAVAEVVGRKLFEIAQGNQVLCITHLPQIAAFADAHFVVEKGAGQARAKTGIRALKNRDEREGEIARMLGGLTITRATREHAREMLNKK